ncbi:ribosomal protein S16, partial [Melanogaster broomeanus]
MPIRIRMAMHGRKHNKIFHLVAIDQRKGRDAKPAELLGKYNPAVKLGDTYKTVEWSAGRIRYWLGVGAIPSKSAVRLLEWGGIIPPDSKYHPKALGPRTTSGSSDVADSASTV